MPVFAADPRTLEIGRDISSPLDLAVFATYAKEDRGRVRKIVDYLEKERNFDIWMDMKSLMPGSDWQREIEGGVTGQIQRGGYQIVFWSRHSAVSKSVKGEVIFGLQDAANTDYSRTLFAILEEAPVPNYLRDFNFAYNNYNVVQLYGDKVRSETHRLDDLIVRLHWLIYRNTTGQDRY